MALYIFVTISIWLYNKFSTLLRFPSIDRLNACKWRNLIPPSFFLIVKHSQLIHFIPLVDTDFSPTKMSSSSFEVQSIVDRRRKTLMQYEGIAWAQDLIRVSLPALEKCLYSNDLFSSTFGLWWTKNWFLVPSNYWGESHIFFDSNALLNIHTKGDTELEVRRSVGTGKKIQIFEN